MAYHCVHRYFYSSVRRGWFLSARRKATPTANSAKLQCRAGLRFGGHFGMAPGALCPHGHPEAGSAFARPRWRPMGHANGRHERHRSRRSAGRCGSDCKILIFSAPARMRRTDFFPKEFLRASCGYLLPFQQDFVRNSLFVAIFRSNSRPSQAARHWPSFSRPLYSALALLRRRRRGSQNHSFRRFVRAARGVA